MKSWSASQAAPTSVQALNLEGRWWVWAGTADSRATSRDQRREELERPRRGLVQQFLWNIPGTASLDQTSNDTWLLKPQRQPWLVSLSALSTSL